MCRFVGICYHVLITQTVAPGSLGGRQPSVPPLVSGSVFWGPTCCWLPSVDACLPRFPTGDGRANNHNTTTGHDPPSVTGTTQTHLSTYRLNILDVHKKLSWSLEEISTQYCVRLRIMRKCVTISLIRQFHVRNLLS